MFEDYSLVTTVTQGKGNRYGVVGGEIRFGYIPDRNTGRDFPVADFRVELGNQLRALHCSIEDLPTSVQLALESASGFTLVRGAGPKGYDNRIPVSHLIKELQDHPQMIRTLELCKIYILANGQVQNGGQPLGLPAISPMEGAEQPRTLTIPTALKDPESGEKVSTTANGTLPTGSLTLRTSNASMRWSRKGRHNIIYKTSSGYIGYVPVAELDIQSPYRDRIYGECTLEALDPFKQNDRARLAVSPLTRALQGFVSQQLEAFAKEFEARDRRRSDQEERDALSKMNEALDKWKNRFLSEYMRGLWGLGTGGPPPPPPPLPSGKPARIEVSLTHQLAGLGVSFRPTIKFFDATGKRIRPTPYRWISEDTNVAVVDEDLMVVNTFSYGRTNIYAETHDGKLTSNKLPLEVVLIRSIEIVPNRIEIEVGRRLKLDAVCRLTDNSETSNLYLVWTEDAPSIARISAAGLVFGFSVGETKVVAGDDHCIAQQPASVVVVQSQRTGRGDKKGQGYPLVLISDYDYDPETLEDRHFMSDEPPVLQEPRDVDRNIWWINSSAPLARLYLNKDRGYGLESSEWRMYHLERYVDAIVQIAITNSPREGASMSVDEWIGEWGSKAAEIQAAAATDLADFLTSGVLPEG